MSLQKNIPSDLGLTAKGPLSYMKAEDLTLLFSYQAHGSLGQLSR